MKTLAFAAAAVIMGSVVLADGPVENAASPSKPSSGNTMPAILLKSKESQLLIDDLSDRFSEELTEQIARKLDDKLRHRLAAELSHAALSGDGDSTPAAQTAQLAHDDRIPPADEDRDGLSAGGPGCYECVASPGACDAGCVYGAGPAYGAACGCGGGGFWFLKGHPCSCIWPTGWYGTAEALWLKRDRGSRINISVDDERDLFVLDTHDLDFDYEPGMRITAGRVIDNGTLAIEGSHFFLHNWSASAGVTSPGEDLDPYWGDDLEAFDAGSFEEAFQHRISYRSRLRSAELNLRRWLTPCTSVLAGVRYVKVKEQFSFFSQDDAPPGDPEDRALYRIKTDNDLVGLQLGFRHERCPTCKLRVGVQGKAGVFVNFAEQESRFVTTPSPGPPARPRIDLRTGADDERFSTVVDLGIYASWRLTGCLAIRGGYDVFFVNGVALAPDQLDTSPTRFNSRAHLFRDNGSLIYHGPSVGVEVLW